MWFPMQVGSDEKRFAWQDEGLTRFNQAQGMQQFFKGLDREGQARESYQRLARADGEVELMRHGDLYPYDTPAYGVASYDKMATNLVALRGLVGDRRFREAYREYGEALAQQASHAVGLLEHLQRSRWARISRGSGAPGGTRPGPWIRRWAR